MAAVVSHTVQIITLYRLSYNVDYTTTEKGFMDINIWTQVRKNIMKNKQCQR